MKTHLVALGAFVVVGFALFGAALFLIGNRHQAFHRHEQLYVEMANITGVAPGSKVRVDGFDAGQVKKVQVPDRPSARFRLELDVIEEVHQLIRHDSLVTVESDGLVGDKYMLIHAGSDHSPEATNGFTLRSKEPIEISAMMEKASGVMDQANTMVAKASGVIDQANLMIPEVRVKLNGSLDSLKGTLDNANGLVTEARSGNGVVSMLLSDQQTAGQVKQVLSNVQQTSVNINQASSQAQQLVADVQSRNLPAKIDDTMVSARDATQQLNETSHKLNTTIAEALGPDSSGIRAGQNLRDTLSNVDVSTANLADDTEALKHGFLFRGFFKKRGFYSLKDLTADGYRSSTFFQNGRSQRFWIAGMVAFAKDSSGAEVLSQAGRQQIDQIIGSMKDSVLTRPLVIEGYSTAADAAQQMTLSSQRAVLVEHYLIERFHLHSTNIGLVSLNAQPPQSSGKNAWDGVGIVVLPQGK